MRREPEKNENESPDRFQRIGGILTILATAVFAFILINSAYLAYADGLEARGEKAKLNTRIEAMEVRLEDETMRAINNLDPDYRRAVYERERVILAPGEEILPIYAEEEDEQE